MQLVGIEDVLEEQKTPMLYWAACVKTMNVYELGDSPSQDELRKSGLRELFGLIPAKYREAATQSEILYALAPGARKAMLLRLVIDPLELVFSLDHQEILVELAAGRPLITGFSDLRDPSKGHAYLIIGASYYERYPDSVTRGFSLINSLLGDKYSNRQYAIHELVLYDPLKDTIRKDPLDRIEDCTVAEFESRSDFALSRQAAVKEMTERAEWVTKHNLGLGVYVRNTLMPWRGPVMSVKYDPEVN